MVISIIDDKREWKVATLTLKPKQEIVLMAGECSIWVNFNGKYYLLPQEKDKVQELLSA